MSDVPIVYVNLHKMSIYPIMRDNIKSIELAIQGRRIDITAELLSIGWELNPLEPANVNLTMLANIVFNYGDR